MIGVQTTTTTKVGAITALSVKQQLSRTYNVSTLQVLLDSYSRHLRALKEDLSAEGLVRFINPAHVQALVLLSNTDKVVLAQLLEADILNRLELVEDNSGTSTAISDLQVAVQGLQSTVDNLTTRIEALESASTSP